MRNIISILSVVLGFTLLANSVEDSVIVFSTKGPDKYADGTKVLDGESYALVWTKDGVFEGFSADGKVLDDNDKVVVVAPLAKDGRLPKTVFQIPVKSAANYGKYEVFLMDTRVATQSGVVAPCCTKDGKAELLNGYGKVAAEIALSSTSSKAENATIVNLNSAAPKNSNQPRVKAMRIEGDEVILTVENAPGFMRVQSGNDTSTSDATSVAIETPSASETITIKAPKMGDKGFYRVIHNSK
jgi:hypothetical protein